MRVLAIYARAIRAGTPEWGPVHPNFVLMAYVFNLF